jgi:hypothetical protein
MPVAASRTITEQLGDINKPSDKPRSFIRAALALEANILPRPATPAIPGATATAPPTRPAFIKSAGLPSFYGAVDLFPSIDGASTNFRLELAYSPAVLAHSLEMRAALIQTTSAPLILRPLAGATPLSTPVDILERYLYDLAIALGATATISNNPVTGQPVIVLTGQIAGQTFASLLLEDVSSQPQ